MFHLQLRKKWAETTLCLACHFLQITGCTSPGKTVSIVVRGSNKLVIEEAERSIHDALCVIRCLVKKRSVSHFWRVNFIVKKILNEPENIPLHAGSHGKVGLFKNTFRYSYRYDCPLTKALLHWRILQERNKQEEQYLGKLAIIFAMGCFSNFDGEHSNRCILFLKMSFWLLLFYFDPNFSQ